MACMWERLDVPPCPSSHPMVRRQKLAETVLSTFMERVQLAHRRGGQHRVGGLWPMREDWSTLEGVECDHEEVVQIIRCAVREHYIVVRIRKDDDVCKVRIYDPLVTSVEDCSGSQVTSSVMEQVMALCSHISNGPTTPTLDAHYVLNIERQEDDWSCGHRAISYVMDLLNEFDPINRSPDLFACEQLYDMAQDRRQSVDWDGKLWAKDRNLGQPETCQMVTFNQKEIAKKKSGPRGERWGGGGRGGCWSSGRVEDVSNNDNAAQRNDSGATGSANTTPSASVSNAAAAPAPQEPETSCLAACYSRVAPAPRIPPPPPQTPIQQQPVGYNVNDESVALGGRVSPQPGPEMPQAGPSSSQAQQPGPSRSHASPPRPSESELPSVVSEGDSSTPSVLDFPPRLGNNPSTDGFPPTPQIDRRPSTHLPPLTRDSEPSAGPSSSGIQRSPMPQPALHDVLPPIPTVEDEDSSG
ncbi:unnamed protein product, partial [Mesorhabditis spiculigera]